MSHRARSKAPAPPWRSFSLRQHSRTRLPTLLVRPGKSLPLRVPPLAAPDRRLGSMTAGPPASGRNEPEREPPREPCPVRPPACPWPGLLRGPSAPGRRLAARCCIARLDCLAVPACALRRAEACSPRRGSGLSGNSSAQDRRTHSASRDPPRFAFGIRQSLVQIGRSREWKGRPQNHEELVVRLFEDTSEATTRGFGTPFPDFPSRPDRR